MSTERRRPIFFEARVPQRNFLLIVDPVLIVRSQACIQNPLLKAEIALCQVVGDCVSFGRAGVSGEVRNAGNDATAPMVNDLLSLVREYLAGKF